MEAAVEFPEDCRHSEITGNWVKRISFRHNNDGGGRRRRFSSLTDKAFSRQLSSVFLERILSS